MFSLDHDQREFEIVNQMYQYMVKSGVLFKKPLCDDSSPYAIMQSKSSIGYRKKSKWNQTGMVFFCCEEDKNNLVHDLGLIAYDNADNARPYALFIPDELFEAAVETLKKNPLNYQHKDYLMQ